MTQASWWRRRGRARRAVRRRRRLADQNEVFLAFDHTLRGKGVRLPLGSPALRQAGALVLRAIRRDELCVHVSSGWVLLPMTLAPLLSPLTFVLEQRVLNRYPRRELPVHLSSTTEKRAGLRDFRDRDGPLWR